MRISRPLPPWSPRPPPGQEAAYSAPSGPKRVAERVRRRAASPACWARSTGWRRAACRRTSASPRSTSSSSGCRRSSCRRSTPATWSRTGCPGRSGRWGPSSAPGSPSRSGCRSAASVVPSRLCQIVAGHGRAGQVVLRPVLNVDSFGICASEQSKRAPVGTVRVLEAEVRVGLRVVTRAERPAVEARLGDVVPLDDARRPARRAVGARVGPVLADDDHAGPLRVGVDRERVAEAHRVDLGPASSPSRARTCSRPGCRTSCRRPARRPRPRAA